MGGEQALSCAMDEAHLITINALRQLRTMLAVSPLHFGGPP
jgi:hypothetical protein